MQFGFDPLASFIAVLALVVTLREIRRANRHLFRLVACQTSFTSSGSKNHWQGFYSLSITLANIGIEAARPRVSLSVQTNIRVGRLILDMPRVYPRDDTAVSQPTSFSRGSKATFALKSYTLGNEKLILKGFESLRRPIRLNDIRIVISQDGFEIGVVRAGTLLDWLRSLWNPLAFRFNRLFWREVVIEGERLMSCPQILPQLPSLEGAITQFVEGVTSEHHQRRVAMSV